MGNINSRRHGVNPAPILTAQELDLHESWFILTYYDGYFKLFIVLDYHYDVFFSKNILRTVLRCMGI